ncbi:MAG: hypothetical protein ACLFR1_01065 [Spirochaetia bacterium]
MKVITWNEITTADQLYKEPISLTVGVFDGVHAGHLELIHRVAEGPSNTAPWVCTFRQNPREIIAPWNFPGAITSLDQRLNIFRNEGIAGIILIDFSPDFSKLTGEVFWQYLLKAYTISMVVIGDNFHCGRNSHMSASDVNEYLTGNNIDVVIEKPFQLAGDRVSSSRIRSLITKGELILANQLLTRPYSLDLRHAPGNAAGGSTTYRTHDFSQVLPPQGIYRVTAVRKSGVEEQIYIYREELSIRLDVRKGLEIESLVFTENAIKGDYNVPDKN